MNTSVELLESEVVVLIAYTELHRNERVLMKAILEPHGFHLLFAQSIAELVQAYQERREEIDFIVVITYQMSGLDAPAILDVLRAIDPAVRCAFIIGERGQDLTKRGAAGILLKPWRPDELLVAMRNWSQRWFVPEALK